MQDLAYKKLCGFIAALDGGRFADLFAAVSLKKECFSCQSMDESQDNYYRCCVSGSCPPATLHPVFLEYVLRRAFQLLGEEAVKE